MSVRAASKVTRRAAKPKAKRHFNPTRLPVLLFVVLLVYFLVLTGGQFVRLYTLELSVRRAERELKELEARNEALWKQVYLLQSDAYVESLAREKLGLVKPGEVPVVVTITPHQKPEGPAGSRSETGE